MSSPQESESSATRRAAAPPMGGWQLSGCVGEQAGVSHTVIAKDAFLVGRDPASDLCLPSRRVSKRHAEFSVLGSEVVLRDLGSTNGTFVNGQRITDRVRLAANDLIQFADTEFRLEAVAKLRADHTAVTDRPEDNWLISRLYEVLNERRLRMVYQPIVSVEGFRTMGYEALVRCDITGLNTPPLLFEAAARMGLEERVSTLCRAEAVRTLDEFPLEGMLFLNTHANEHLGGELVESLARLRRMNEGRKLVLEIHEAAVPDLATIREFRAALRDLDIGLAYDDFGAGQSRLLELAQVPPDFLKFDRSFVKDLGDESAPQLALVRTLHNAASDLGIATLAEGLDCEAAVQACVDIGFTHFQGFYFGRPSPASQLLLEAQVLEAAPLEATMEATMIVGFDPRDFERTEPFPVDGR